MAQKSIFDNAVRTENGLELNGFVLNQVIDRCDGCERIKEIEGEQYCTSYPDPEAKWRHGACNFATHVKASMDKKGQVKVNPLKASKRAARNR
ncbi:MAG: PxxKW family cysteine-rich protein [Thermodesulfobacteriota bacterium]